MGVGFRTPNGVNEEITKMYVLYNMNSFRCFCSGSEQQPISRENLNGDPCSTGMNQKIVYNRRSDNNTSCSYIALRFDTHLLGKRVCVIYVV